MDEPNLSDLSAMIGCVTAVKLREWREVKPVAGPSGVAITTRLRTTPDDEHVLDLVAEHLGGLRRADLAAITRQLDPGKNAATGPGNRYPGTGRQRATTSVTVASGNERNGA